MKMEFNSNSFSASMSRGEAPTLPNAGRFVSSLLKDNKVIVLGVLALFIALLNLPYGLFTNFATEFVREVYASGVGYWLTVMLILSSVMILTSIALAVFATVIFATKEKRSLDILGFIFSILSYVVSACCIVLNIISISLF